MNQEVYVFRNCFSSGGMLFWLFGLAVPTKRIDSKDFPKLIAGLGKIANSLEANSPRLGGKLLVL